jgi:hypothetical protein
MPADTAGGGTFFRGCRRSEKTDRGSKVRRLLYDLPASRVALISASNGSASCDVFTGTPGQFTPQKGGSTK